MVGYRERRMGVGMVVEGRVSARERDRRRHMEGRRFVVGRERRRRDRVVDWSSLAEAGRGCAEERRSWVEEDIEMVVRRTVVVVVVGEGDNHRRLHRRILDSTLLLWVLECAV
jgi:hypothetical protein